MPPRCDSRTPRRPEDLYEMGLTAAAAQDWPRAVRFFQRALNTRSAHASYYNSLAVALWAAGHRSESLRAFEQALRLFPGSADLLGNRASVLWDCVDLRMAYNATEAALPHAKNRPSILNWHAIVLEKMGLLLGSTSYLREYLALKPEDTDAWNNLAVMLSRQGRVDEAVLTYDRSLPMSFDVAVASNRLMTLHYTGALSRKRMFLAHRSWAAELEALIEPRTNGVKPRLLKSRGIPRRIRVGYVSGDLKRHSVSCFFEPLLQHHDPARFEIHCFSNTARTDAVTRRLQRHAAWHDIVNSTDDEVAAQIRRARIDVLVDLSGHTAGNRLPLFTHQPAPIQATYLGYPNTTGLRSIQYRLTDSIADPPSPSGDALYSETLVRIDPCFLSYRPPERFHAKNRDLNRAVTFACFAIREKLSHAVLTAWAEILDGSSNSVLLLKNKALGDPAVASELRDFFRARGIDPERLVLSPYTANPRRHLDDYQNADLMLDPFPYNGTTATCEALSSGIPVLTYAGDQHASRVGASILTNVGLSQLVAHTKKEYVRRAIELATNTVALGTIRRELPAKWRASPLVDGAGLTRRIEDCYFKWMRS